MALIPWEPSYELGRLREEMNRLFDRSFNDIFPVFGRQPSVDIFQTENDVVIKAEMPGVNPQDLDINVTENTVTLQGEIKHINETNEEGYIRKERRYGKFYRTFPLPVEVKPENARASLKNGILEIRLPKSEKAKQKGIKIKVEGDNTIH
ncbi:MAG: hypothetical protein PWP21_643 [Thermosediminibacterales bacterium]|nr:hypothetical protein [Thermosediminibacterales bacterium]